MSRALGGGAATTLATPAAAASEIVSAIERTRRLRAAEENLRDSVSLDEGAQRRLTARLEIIQRWREQRRNADNIVQAQYRFAETYSSGAIAVSADTRELYPTLSRGTLVRWESEIRKRGTRSLAGRYGNRAGKSRITEQPELSQFLIAVLTAYPHASARTIYDGLLARFSERNDLSLPGRRAVERWLDKWKQDNAEVLAAISNPDKWKSEFMVGHGSISEDIERLNQRWEFDATPADVMLLDGRHTISGVIDIYSRRAKLLVTRSNTATALAALIRRALLDWGVPEQLKIDNGQEYVGHHFSRVITDLEIEPIVSPPFQPWRKAHIERFFNTFSHGLVELLPGFIGHNVAERKALEARKSFAERLMTKGEVIEVKMTASELQTFCDRWCESLYMHRRQDGIGCAPFERAANWTGDVKRIRDERALDLLLAEAPDNHGRRSVHKKGIRIKWPHESAHHWYIAPELAAWVKHQVRVLYDPAGDMGRVYVFGQDGFICIAECPELAGIDRAEYAAAAKARQQRSVQEQRRELRAASREAKVENLSEEILAAAERRAGNVTLFRRPGSEHDVDALAGAADAVAAADALAAPRTYAPVSEESMHRAAAMLDQDGADPMETPEGRFARALELLNELSSAAADELDWLRGYQQTSEFRGRYRAWQELRSESDHDDPAGIASAG